MTDTIIDFLQKELQKYPEETHLKRLLDLARRREALHNRPPAPDRTREAMEAKLLTRILFMLRPIPAIEDRFPVDEEIIRLFNINRLIDPDTGKRVSCDIGDRFLREAIWLGRTAVVDGCAWGDYYARYKLGHKANQTTDAKLAMEDINDAIVTLQALLFNQSHLLISGRLTSPARPFNREVEILRQAESALEEMQKQLEVVASDPGGRPGNPWRVGFIFGVSQTWWDITNFKVSVSEPFASFISQCGATVFPRGASKSLDWTAAIRTAKLRFGLARDGRSWARRPGDAETVTNPPP